MKTFRDTIIKLLSCYMTEDELERFETKKMSFQEFQSILQKEHKPLENTILEDEKEEKNLVDLEDNELDFNLDDLHFDI